MITLLFGMKIVFLFGIAASCVPLRPPVEVNCVWMCSVTNEISNTWHVNLRIYYIQSL